MNREQAEKLLAALVFDDLDESSKAELLTYLQGDDDLRDRLADLRMAVKLTCDAVNEGPDPVLVESRLKKLQRLAGTRKGGTRIFSLRRLSAVAAVLVIGVVLVGLLMPSLHKVRRYQMRSELVYPDNQTVLSRRTAPAVRRSAPAPAGSEEAYSRLNSREWYGGMGGMGGYAGSTADSITYEGGMMGGMEGVSNAHRAQSERRPEQYQPELPTGTIAGRGAEDIGKAIADVADHGYDAHAGRKALDERRRAEAAASLTQLRSPRGPSFGVAGPGSDRSSKELDSASEAEGSRNGRSLSYAWSGTVTPAKSSVPFTPPVPAQSAPTSSEKADRRVPVLGDAPIVGGLFRNEPQADGDSDGVGSREISNRDKRPDSAASAVADGDRLVVLDLPSVVVPREMPELNAALPPFESRFAVVPVNPWVMTERDALSTFALDVDTASYTLCRQYIRNGFLPPIGAVRMEEFINAFDYAYPQRDGATFAVYAEGAPSPFAPAGRDLTLLKIAVKARTIGRDQRRAAHIVFVVDASASMGQPDRLPLVQSALNLLLDKLSDADRVSLVTCADQARLHLEAIPALQKDTIRQTIDAIQPAGPTNLLAGLKLGYEMARRGFVAGQINQVVLCSDGVANVGQTEAQDILDEVAEDRKQGITLTCVGVGYGAYNDAFLESLADRGDGRYVFLDSSEQGRETLVGQLAATLQIVAKDARIQVQFDPACVRRYRLIGYENRDIEDQRFRDDTVDAGEVGSGQCSTALYELELAAPPAGEGETDLGTVFVRYRNTDTSQIEEVSRPLARSLIRRRSVGEDPRFFLAAGAARFAEWLRQSEHARETSLADIQDMLDRVSAALPLDQSVQDLAALAHQAESLPRATQTLTQP